MGAEPGRGWDRRSALTLAYLIACAIALGWTVYALWPAPGSILWPSWPAMLAAMASWFGMILVLTAGWTLILRTLHPARPRLRLLLMLQAQAWVGRYLPAKAGLLIGKSVGARELTMAPGLVASSVLIEQLAFLSLGALLSAVVLLWHGARIAELNSSLDPALVLSVLAPLLALGAALGLVMLHALWARSTLLGRSALQQFGSWPPLLVVYTIANALPGLGMYILAGDLALFVDVSLLQWVGIAAFVNIAGMLVLFAPAGLGARELVLGICLTEHGSAEEVVLFVAGFRLLTILADALFYACWGKLGLAGWMFRSSGSNLTG
jgi:hypothetical protein